MQALQQMQRATARPVLQRRRRTVAAAAAAPAPPPLRPRAVTAPSQRRRGSRPARMDPVRALEDDARQPAGPAPEPQPEASTSSTSTSSSSSGSFPSSLGRDDDAVDASAAPLALTTTTAAATTATTAVQGPLGSVDRSAIEAFLRPAPEELPDDLEMPIWDHLEELRERALVGLLAAGVAIAGCFCFSKELVLFLEAPVADAGVRFLQLSPGEFFFTTFKVAGYSGLLLAAPTMLYELIAYIVPGLTKSERRFLAPVVFGSSILFYVGLVFSYEILTPAALNFFVSYAEGAVESLWSIDQYFQFVLVLMLSTGLSFQVPVIQVLLGQLGIVSSTQMFSQWRYVVVGATVAAAVLTPSTDPFTQTLLAVPLVGLYLGGAAAVRLLEGGRDKGSGDAAAGA